MKEIHLACDRFRKDHYQFCRNEIISTKCDRCDRTVMVVDRTDLDAQTQDEFTKFASEYHTGQTTGNSVANTLIVGIKIKNSWLETSYHQKIIIRF